MIDESATAEALACVLDGEPASARAAQLCAAVADDAELALRFAQHLALESALRALAPAPDVSAGVMEALHARESARSRVVVANVMSAVDGRERWPVRARRRRARRVAYVTAGTLAALAVGAFAAWRWAARDRSSDRPTVASRTDVTSMGAPAPSTAGRGPTGQSRLSSRPAEAVTSDPASFRIFRFDFEDGVLPPGFEQGQVVADVSRAGNRFAVMGTFNAWAPNRASIFINPGRPLFFFEPGLVLRFRCYPSGSSVRVRLQVFDAEQRQNHQFDVADVPARTWATVEAPLDRFYPVLRRGERPANGDRMMNLFVITGELSQPPVLIDDLELVRAHP